MSRPFPAWQHPAEFCRTPAQQKRQQRHSSGAGGSRISRGKAVQLNGAAVWQSGGLDFNLGLAGWKMRTETGQVMGQDMSQEGVPCSLLEEQRGSHAGKVGSQGRWAHKGSPTAGAALETWMCPRWGRDVVRSAGSELELVPGREDNAVCMCP